MSATTDLYKLPATDIVGLLKRQSVSLTAAQPGQSWRMVRQKPAALVGHAPAASRGSSRPYSGQPLSATTLLPGVFHRVQDFHLHRQLIPESTLFQYVVLNKPKTKLPNGQTLLTSLALAICTVCLRCHIDTNVMYAEIALT